MSSPPHEQASSPPVLPSTAQAAPLQQRVLVAEDHEDARVSLKQLLELSLGLEADTVEDGAQALEALLPAEAEAEPGDGTEPAAVVEPACEGFRPLTPEFAASLHMDLDPLQEIAELLEVVGLSDVANRKLKGFSGGMRRRVGIAQALLGDPALLVVDEPTAGLDPQERIRFRTLLATLPGRRTVLLSTHVVEDVAQTCRETAVMVDGRIVFTGAVSDLVRGAEGVTWEVVTSGPPPTVGEIVSAVSDAGGTRYRVVSVTPPDPAAIPVPPSLEDGYVAFMQGAAAGRSSA